jgi:two-component system, LytTR family, response regulator
MIEAIIIDDELHCVETLTEKLKMYCPEIEVIKTFVKPTEAIHYLSDHDVDVVFLDIEMPVLNGFSMLEKLGRINFQLVFTTAYDQYAIKAIKFSAFDYLLKPVSKEDLLALAQRLATKKLPEKTTDEQFSVLMQHLSQGATDQMKISIPTHEGIIFTYVKDLIRVESESNYSYIHFSNRKPILVSKTLKEFEDLLTPYKFFRVHNSHLINTRLIAKYVKSDGGSVIMENGDRIEISRRKKESLESFLALA